MSEKPVTPTFGIYASVNRMYGPQHDCKRNAEGEKKQSASMYPAFGWRVNSPGHDEFRACLFLRKSASGTKQDAKRF